MIESISRDMYAALEAKAAADPHNADAVCCFRAVVMRIENGSLRLESWMQKNTPEVLLMSDPEIIPRLTIILAVLNH